MSVDVCIFFLRANVKRASITADPTRIEVNMHVSFALNNLADQPTEIVRKFRAHGLRTEATNISLFLTGCRAITDFSLIH